MNEALFNSPLLPINDPALLYCWLKVQISSQFHKKTGLLIQPWNERLLIRIWEMEIPNNNNKNNNKVILRTAILRNSQSKRSNQLREQKVMTHFDCWFQHKLSHYFSGISWQMCPMWSNNYGSHLKSTGSTLSPELFCMLHVSKIFRRCGIFCHRGQ